MVLADSSKSIEEKMSLLKKIYASLNEKIIDRYGLAQVLKQYGFYPQFLPITITGEHGPSLWDYPINEAMGRISPFYFVTSKYKEDWKMKRKILVRHPNQFVWYRRRNGISVDRNRAVGSLFFYSHSSKSIKVDLSIERLLGLLSGIPDHFKPVTICLHFNDLENGLTSQIALAGYHWICLSKSYDESQIEQYYKVLPRFKYVLGNAFTSGLLYACELGIPVSLVFYENVSYTNLGNTHFGTTGWNLVEEYNEHTMTKKALDIFSGFHESITPEQMDFTRNILGLDLINLLSNRLKISFYLYASLVYVSTVTLFRKLFS